MAVVQANENEIRRAADHLRNGELVAFPTEPVYGLGADATNGQAVARIFEAKGRPRFNPLIVHVPDIGAAEHLAEFSDKATTLARAFWPGAFTLVLKRKADSNLSELISAGLDTVAIRIPDHPIAQALLNAAGRPLAAPSANRSGHVSATQARHVAEDLGERVAMILDGGPTAFGIESTVLDATSDNIVLLRPGAIPADTIEAVLGEPLTRNLDGGAQPLSPGQLQSHYAPHAALRLHATSIEPGEALLAFGTDVPNATKTNTVINLSPSGNMIEAAANLFAAMRMLDAKGVRTIAVMPIPQDGLGEAINDRLKRAAAPREAGS